MRFSVKFEYGQFSQIFALVGSNQEIVWNVIIKDPQFILQATVHILYIFFSYMYICTLLFYRVFR